MKIKPHLLLLLFVFTFLLSWGQSIDSLKFKLIQPSINISERAKIKYKIARNYFNQNTYDSALKYSTDALKDFEDFKKDKNLVSILLLQSRILNKQGFNKRLFPTQHRLILALLANQDSTGLMDAYDKMGLYFYHLGVIDSAMYYYKMAFGIGKITNNKKALMDSYNNISQLYNYQGKYQEELRYLHKGLNMAIAQSEDFSKATFYHNIALSHINLQEFDSALIYINKAIDINTSLNKMDRLALNKTALGNVYAMQGDVKKAMVYFNEALLYYSKSGNLYGQVESNYNLGYSYYYLKDYSPALKYFFESLRLAKIINTTSYQIDIYISLSNVYKGQGDDKKALSYYKYYHNLQDSLTRSTNVQFITKAQTEFEFERNSIEIKLLNKESELKDKKFKNTIVIALISLVSIIILSILLVLIFRKLRKNEELNKQLVKQNYTIQESHTRLKKFEETIQDDIKYAKNIQHYFYNDSKIFDKIFSEHFFRSFTTKPLNNSLLWTNKVGNKLYWAIITLNHDQLKGAYTGMYVYNMLNKVFFSKKFSGVESFFKTFIYESFPTDKDQTWGKVQMLFCSFDIKKAEIQFVNIGINAELIRNAKVWEFKPLYPYVSSEKSDSIISNKVQIQSNDRLLFFSKNWSIDDEPFSVGKLIFNETVTSKEPEVSDFVDKVIGLETTNDFVLLSLKM